MGRLDIAREPTEEGRRNTWAERAVAKTKAKEPWTRQRGRLKRLPEP